MIGQVPVTEVTPLPTQVLFIEKHPDFKLIPEPKVDVAVAEILMVFAPVFPRERRVPGVVVPIPTLPLFKMDITLVLAEFTKFAMMFAPVSAPHTLNLLYGVVVPTPTLPPRNNAEIGFAFEAVVEERPLTVSAPPMSALVPTLRLELIDRF